MRTHDRAHATRAFASLLCLLFAALGANAQTPQRDEQRRAPVQPVVTAPTQSAAPSPYAGNTSAYYCAGYIARDPALSTLEIVGGEQEQEQAVYSEGDIVYINVGASQGARAGQEYSVIRPRGRFKSSFSRKDGTLGVFTQEVGRLRVDLVKDNYSVAQVIGACETILLGDVLRAVPTPMSAASETQIYIADDLRTPQINRFADSSGKQQGRIVMARDAREALAANHVVYIDLGSEDNVRAGDLLTIYRPLGKGNFREEVREITPNKVRDYESDVFKGGKFSNKAQRAQDPNGTGLNDQDAIRTAEVKRRRPAMPRKIVGEMVIINVEARTATAIITRTAQEVHTGDYVEVK